MAADILSQEEVDALLQGTAEIAEQPAAPVSGVRSYNLATHDRIVRGRMPALEIVNERFVRQLRIALSAFLHRAVGVSAGPVQALKYAEFTRALAAPANLNMVQIKPLRGTALFVVDPQLAFVVVEHLFGSDGRFGARAEAREFTHTETRIVQRLLGIVFAEYEKSWAPLRPVKFEYLRTEVNSQFASIATPNEVVIAFSFRIELGAAGGELHVCIPYAMLEPMRDALYSSRQGEQTETDQRWMALLTRQIQEAQVELVARFGEASVTLRQILEMRTGDVVPIEVGATVQAEVDGVPVLESRYGLANGHYALKVERALGTGRDHPKLGERHA